MRARELQTLIAKYRLCGDDQVTLEHYEGSLVKLHGLRPLAGGKRVTAEMVLTPRQMSLDGVFNVLRDLTGTLARREFDAHNPKAPFALDQRDLISMEEEGDCNPGAIDAT